MTSSDATVVKEITNSSCINLKSSNNHGMKKQRRQLDKSVFKAKSIDAKKELLSRVLDSASCTDDGATSKSDSPLSRSHSLTSSSASNFDTNNFLPPELALYWLQMQQQLAAYSMMLNQQVQIDSALTNPNSYHDKLSSPVTVGQLPPLDCQNKCQPSSLIDIDNNNTSSIVSTEENGNMNRKNYKSLTRERRVEANARERSRVHTISAAFENLRQCIPAYSSNQKLSKLAILRIACRYIESLACLLDLDYSGDQSEKSFNVCVQRLCDTLNCESRTKRA